MRRRKLIALGFMLLLALQTPMPGWAIDYVASIGGSINGQARHGNYLYVSQRDSIHVFEIRAEKVVREVGCFREPGNQIERMVLRWPALFYEHHGNGNYYWWQLGGLDLRNPIQPQKITGVAWPSSKGGASWFLLGSRLVFSNKIFDIANPLKPHRLKTMEEEDLALYRQYLDQGSVEDFSTSETLNIPPVPESLLYAGSVEQVKADGNTVYVMEAGKQIKVINVRDPLHPKYIGVTKDAERIRQAMVQESAGRMGHETEFSKRRLVFKNKYEIRLELSEPEEGDYRLFVQDISDPAHPKRVAILDEEPSYSTYEITTLWQVGDILAVFRRIHNTGMGIYVLSLHDISNPEKPRKLGAYPEPDESDHGDFDHGFVELPGGIAIANGLVYVAEGENGLTILRLNKPEHTKTQVKP